MPHWRQGSADERVDMKEDLKVCVAAGGAFHILDLARQLQRLGHLQHLYTGVPFWKIVGLPPDKVSRHSLLLAPAQLAARANWTTLYNLANHTAIAAFD